jgi:hypothetical protein
MKLETIATLEIINFDASLNTTNFAGVSDQQIAWIQTTMKYFPMMA